MKKKKNTKSLEQSFKDKFTVEYEHTVKSFKSINRHDLPIYTKKYDGDWLYRLRIHKGFLKADRIIIKPYFELTESTISNVLGIDNIESNQEEWRLAMHNLMKYYKEDE
tara:strand:+ start:52 stop:378 length:327 start_codon:yes stop_codon:yes gene_type:complete